MSARISQREARRLRARVKRLEEQQVEVLRYWSQDYTGVWLVRQAVADETRHVVATAAKLGHVIVARVSDQAVDFYALRLPS